MTFTSEFSENIDGPKTDATKGSSAIVNTDLIMAGFSALSISGESLGFEIGDLPEWTGLAKDLIESSANSTNTKTEMQDNSKPQIEPGKSSTNKVYSGYKKGASLHTSTGNVRVESDSTGTCCQDDKKATDTIPGLKKKNND